MPWQLLEDMVLLADPTVRDCLCLLPADFLHILTKLGYGFPLFDVWSLPAWHTC